MTISIYKNAYEKETDNKISIKEYFNNVKNGQWEDIIFKYKTGKLKKELIPAVMPSGIFENGKKNEDIKSHSGYICIDIDTKENPEILNQRDEIYTDPYLFCGCLSVSGGGLALFFKIDKRKHIESYLGLEKYLSEKYKIIADPACKNVARLRFVSYDPDLFLNENAKKWDIFIEKKQAQPHNYQPIFSNTDIDFIFQQINARQLDLTEDYYNWIALGFAFANKYGESGRAYFHEVSRYNSKYDYEKCDKKYTNLLNTGSKKFSIGTFFWLAKQNGIDIKSPQTKKIQKVATVRKKQIGMSGGSPDIVAAKKNAVSYLTEIENIEISEVENIVEQVFDNNTDELPQEEGIELIEEYIRSLNAKYNIITQRTEIDGTDLTDRLENSIFLNCKKLFPKEKIHKELITNILNSDRVPEYNPFLDFIKKNKHLKPTGLIDEVLACFSMKNTTPAYLELCSLLIYKWLVSLIASIHGTHSVLILVLVGEQMTNKTNFFRGILPAELLSYYAETKLDRDKDDEILMSQKLILVDDEFAGKSKKEAGKLKELSSKQIITARKSYGKYSEDYKRLGVLAGTSNEIDIINDTTGNRRILPIHIQNIDFNKFKKIDKTELFMELYWTWRRIGDGWMLNREDVTKLNNLTTQYNEISVEEETILKCFKKPEKDEFTEFLTATEMLNYCEGTLNKQRLYHKTFGKVLRKIGFSRVKKKGIWGYKVVKI